MCKGVEKGQNLASDVNVESGELAPMFVSVVLNFLTMSQQPQQTDSNNMSEHSRTRNHEVNMNLQKSTPLTHEGQRSTPLVNRGTTHIFYKTRMCQKFVEGTCRNGDGCTFAHGPKDLREPPPNWQELVKDNRGGGNGSGNWNDDKRIIHRMRICRKFYNGDECPYGEKCNFLHESPAKFKVEAAMDIDRARESSVIKIETVVDRSQSQTEAGPDFVTVVNTDQDASRALVKGTYWKTRICSKWETTGQCIYGDKCHYAHGYAELHTPVGRVEGEGHANVNSYADGSISTNVVHGPIIEPASADPVPQIRGRGFLKLANKKLNRIYGDWIDDEDEST